MSIVEVKVPQLSESVAEATMLQWKKKAGDTVSADEILIEIEADKVVLEVPAPAAGVLSEILVADGGTVVAEQLIARIDTDGKMSASPASAPLAPIPPGAAHRAPQHRHQSQASLLTCGSNVSRPPLAHDGVLAMIESRRAHIMWSDVSVTPQQVTEEMNSVWKPPTPNAS
jgi:pyruvate/2-oxoglutarate dehydrogenase complex dihydrolipoamide acyltransferase (E2) component